MVLCCRIPGTPRGKGRPRFTRRGSTYTPPKTKEAERHIQMCWIIANGSARRPSNTTPIVEIECTFEPPKFWPKWKKEAAIFSGMWYDKKPDADNIAKLVLDALKGLAFNDDSEVQLMGCKKVYGETAHIFVQVTYEPRQETTRPGS